MGTTYCGCAGPPPPRTPPPRTPHVDYKPFHACPRCATRNGRPYGLLSAGTYVAVPVAGAAYLYYRVCG